MPAPLGLNSWTTGDGASALDDLRAGAAAGCRWVELRDAKIERHLEAGGTLDALAHEAARLGIGVLDVHTLDDATLPLGEELERRVRRGAQLAEWASALGARFVTVGPSYGGSDLSREAIRARSAAALARLVEAAAPHGVAIGFEFHGYARCSIHTLADALATLDAVDDARAGLVIDAFHFHVGGSDLAQLAALDPRRLFAVHLCDVDHGDVATLGKNNRVMPGDGVLPLREFVDAVARSGYAGPYSVELFREEDWRSPPGDVARRGVAAMRRFV